MDETFFAERIASLRNQKNVSAREMSLAIGQNASYINRIENHRALPSMQCFFYICEYLGVTPSEFFDTSNPNPEKINRILQELSSCNEKQLNTILLVIENFKKN